MLRNKGAIEIATLIALASILISALGLVQHRKDRTSEEEKRLTELCLKKDICEPIQRHLKVKYIENDKDNLPLPLPTGGVMPVEELKEGV